MKISCDINSFLLLPASVRKDKFELGKMPTSISPLSDSKKTYVSSLDEFRDEIKHLQSILYAHARYSLLVIFQGMDTAGKGGAIKHVLSGVNPQGCHVVSFGPPSSEEFNHDFLWRISKRLPERGRIGIFDRSHYEDVVVGQVHPRLFKHQRLPAELAKAKDVWKQRQNDIVNWESYLHRNGTKIVKIFLHLSFDEQRKRLLRRIDDPDRNWKFSNSDLESRGKWSIYQKVWSDCLENTSSELAPWYIVPADSKKNARLIVSQLIIQALETLKMDYPKSTKQHLEALQKARETLQSTKKGE